jgi:hypothetical protein
MFIQFFKKTKEISLVIFTFFVLVVSILVVFGTLQVQAQSQEFDSFEKKINISNPDSARLKTSKSHSELPKISEEEYKIFNSLLQKNFSSLYSLDNRLKS